MILTAFFYGVHMRVILRVSGLQGYHYTACVSCFVLAVTRFGSESTDVYFLTWPPMGITRVQLPRWGCLVIRGMHNPLRLTKERETFGSLKSLNCRDQYGGKGISFAYCFSLKILICLDGSLRLLCPTCKQHPSSIKVIPLTESEKH